jgi:uncharacterized oligopeptide transporter (OPT) family protein
MNTHHRRHDKDLPPMSANQPPQLTWRAVVSGLLLGGALSLVNVYIGLRTGWFFSVTLLASTLGFTAWQFSTKLGVTKRGLHLLEATCMQSTASSAGYATGNVVVGVAPALLLMSVDAAHPTGIHLPWWQLAIWIALLAMLGVVLAIPLRQRLIEREQLPFPSAAATAGLLQSLYAETKDAKRQAQRLFAALAAGAGWALLRALSHIPGQTRMFTLATERGIVLDHGLALVTAGAFVGLRTSSWLLIGGLTTAFGLGELARSASWMNPQGAVTPVLTGLDLAWRDLGIWAGASMLVAYGVVTLLMQIWSALARFRRQHLTAATHAISLQWFWLGMLVVGGSLVVAGAAFFDISPWHGAIAVACSALLAPVAARVTGETDITPGSAMAKLTQLSFGALAPQQPTVNLMTASMTHASSVACADLLSDWKTGHMLGAEPKRQWIAQAIGIFAGTAASVSAYFLLVPNASVLSGAAPQFAAPGAHQFKAVAQVLQFGFAGVPPLAAQLSIVCTIIGAVLACNELFFKRNSWMRTWLPPAPALGLGLLLPPSVSLSLFLGAFIAHIASKSTIAAPFVAPVATGALAGESFVEIVVLIAKTV